MSMKTETTWSEFTNGEKIIVEHIPALEKEINSKEQDYGNHSPGSK